MLRWCNGGPTLFVPKVFYTVTRKMNKSVFTFEYVYLSLVVYKETHSHSQYDTESCTVSVVKQNMLYNLSKNGFTT